MSEDAQFTHAHMVRFERLLPGPPEKIWAVLTDVSRALREEERQAWQRLIRVLGHELNNSLAPIRSLADSLGQLVARQPRPSDWEDDMRRGLAVIAGRSESLSRFLEAYGRLARLPAPQPQPLDLGPLLRRVAGLEQRVPVAVRDGPAVEIQADPVQLEQVVINLLRNAAEAAVRANKMSIEELRTFITMYQNGMDGYTYLEG